MLWFSIVGLTKDQRLPKHPEICLDHFDPGDVIMKQNGLRYIKPGPTPKPREFSQSEQSTVESTVYSSDSIIIYETPPRKSKEEVQELLFEDLIAFPIESREPTSIAGPSRLAYLLLQLTPINTQDDCINENTQLLCERSVPVGHFPNIETVNISQVKLQTLDFNYFHRSFPNLRRLSVIGNNMTKLKKMEMPTAILNIKILQLSSLQISKFCDNFTSYFPHLEILNISGNYLTAFPNFSYVGLKEVYLSGNKWNCSKSLEWVLKLDKAVFKDINELRCFKMPHNNKPVLAIAEFRKITRETCTQNCSCRLIKCVTDMELGTLEPIIEVNCSFRGFTELPDTFPPKTKTLHLEGNFIEDLSPIKTNLIYRDLLEIFLDNNAISSINVLEGSYWLTRFRVFSLRSNKISELPTYAIDNALQHNVNMPNALRLILGGNPWRCDCIFAPRFKEMLQKYALQISDLRDIKCAKNSENSLVPIIDLSRGSVCHSPSEYTIQEALDLLNGILAFLIIFVLGKLAYDYYYFKKTGRLPWIVTKLP